MTTVLLIAGAWCAIAGATCAAWAAMRTRQKRQVEARQRYTAEAQQLALQALLHRTAAATLTWHDRAVAAGICTADCPRAWEWQLELAAPHVATVPHDTPGGAR